MRSTVLLLCVVAGAACGPLRYSIDRDMLRDITIENKLLLFDAENDVSIAVDEKESIQREIQAVKQDIQDADAERREARSDATRWATKGDAAKEQVATAAIDVYGLKIDYLEDQLGYLRAKLRAQDELILVAWAKYELAKAKLAKSNNVRGSEDVEMADFEVQVDQAVERAKARFEALAATAQEVETVKKVWLDKRNELAKESGGGIGSLWAEDGSFWGSDTE